MSINQLIEKSDNKISESWLKLRINELTVDGETIIDSLSFFNNDGNQTFLDYYSSPETPIALTLSGNNGSLITPFNVEYFRIGDQVLLSLPIFSTIVGTDNLYTALITNTDLIPSKDHVFSVPLTNGANYQTATVRVKTDGEIQIRKFDGTNLAVGQGFDANVSLSYLIK